MADPLVVFEGVTLRSPGGKKVFADFDWTLEQGARVRVAGERGSGGTALLRLCAGLAHPERGRVILGGIPHGERQFSHPFLRQGAVAWIPEDGGLVANLSLIQNVALPLRFIRGASRDEAERAGMALLERLDLEELALLRPHDLGRRERQMGALARSAAMSAELWLLDRPLEDLDSHGLARALVVLREALEAPTATLLVVGDGPQYEGFATNVLRLEGGRLVAKDGT
jgi:polar amino acid transport system ATP-binding protein